MLEELQIVVASFAALLTAVAGLRFVVRSQCVGGQSEEEEPTGDS